MKKGYIILLIILLCFECGAQEKNNADNNFFVECNFDYQWCHSNITENYSDYSINGVPSDYSIGINGGYLIGIRNHVSLGVGCGVGYYNWIKSEGSIWDETKGYYVKPFARFTYSFLTNSIRPFIGFDFGIRLQKKTIDSELEKWNLIFAKPMIGVNFHLENTKIIVIALGINLLTHSEQIKTSNADGEPLSPINGFSNYLGLSGTISYVF